MNGFFLSSRCKKKSVIAINTKDKLYDIPSVIVVHEMSIPDMNNIHSFSIKYFHNLRAKIPDIKEEILNRRKLLEMPQTYIEKKETLFTIDKLESELQDIINEKKKKEYLDEVTPVMNAYKDLTTSQSKVVFGRNINRDFPNNEVTKYMLAFLDIVKRYVGICFNFEISSKYQCIECEFDLTNVIPDLDGSIRCPECRVENESNRCPKLLMAFNKSNSVNHGDYSEKANFYKFITRFQGKYEPHISDDLWPKLDEYFKKEKRSLGHKIKTLSPNDKGFKDGTSLSLMLNALSYYGYSSYYDDIYVICFRYWGWILPDFKEDETIIMYIYDSIQTSYSKIKNKTRTSSLSIPFIAFKITELLNYPYEVSDFKIPKDDKSKEETEYYWRLSCEGCDDPEIVYIPTRKY